MNKSKSTLTCLDILGIVDTSFVFGMSERKHEEWFYSLCCAVSLINNDIEDLFWTLQMKIGKFLSFCIIIWHGFVVSGTSFLVKIVAAVVREMGRVLLQRFPCAATIGGTGGEVGQGSPSPGAALSTVQNRCTKSLFARLGTPPALAVAVAPVCAQAF